MASKIQNVDDFLISMADMPNGGRRDFDLRFTDAQLDMAREILKLQDIRKLRIHGSLVPDGRQNWLLHAEVGASVTQSCVLTLEPVKARIDTDLRRLFLAKWEEPEGDSVVEMTQDEENEPLGSEIDLNQIAIEAIAMALPPYPRAEGATLENKVFSEPGVAPLTDEDVKPFAGLAALKDKMGD